MDKLVVLLVALYRNRNFPIRIMHPLLEEIENAEVHTIFFKDNEGNMFEPPTDKEEELFADLITELKPDLVGFSVLTPYVTIARRLSTLVKENNPSSRVIWGGIHPTIAPDSVIDDVDFLCIGEGEGAMTELVSSLRDGTSYDSIQNLWIKTDGDTIKNPMRPMIMDLDALPFPSFANDNYHFLDDDKLKSQDPLLEDRQIWVQASRGCPYNCTFCVVALEHQIYKGLGPPVRRRSVGSVLEEIAEYRELAGPTADYIFFIDEVFGVNEAWLDEFEERYKEEVGLPFFVEYHPKALNSKRLRQLVNAGMDRVDFGLQTGSDELRDKLFDRRGTNEEIIVLAKEIDSYGVRAVIDLIVDNPYETEETMKETVGLLLQLPKPLHFNLFQLKWFPEYLLTNQALEEGIILEQETSVEHLMQSVGEDWAYVPRVFPYNKKQVLQNIVWLMARNLSGNRVVKFAVFGKSPLSRLCLAYLNAKSIVLGRLLGNGGFVERHPWIAKMAVGFRYLLKGDIKTLRYRIGQHIYTFRQRGSHAISPK